MVEHTPGPWNCDPIYGCRVYADEQLIADTWRQRKTTDECDRDLANAYLIAAAPDMLDALEALEAAYVMKLAAEFGISGPELVELEHNVLVTSDALAAIAKAKNLT